MDSDRLKVLAIDDNRSNLARLRSLFAAALPDCSLITATDGAEGILLARQEDPDAILLDVIMPGLDGFAVCRRLKSEEHLRDIPVVFLTSMRSGRESRALALAAGAEAFLSRPFDDSDLTAQVKAMAKVKVANRIRRMEHDELAALVADRTRELELELAERRRVEAALRKSEAKYRDLTENMTDLVFVVAPDGVLTYLSQAAFALTGHLADELVGRRFIGLVHEEDVAEVEQAFAALMGHPHSEPYELRIRNKRGEIRWIRLSCRQVVDAGRVTGLQGVATDISNRKSTETQREHLATAIDQVAESVVVTDKDGTIVYVNPTFESVTGYAREEVLGRNVRLTKSGVQDDAFYRSLWTTILGGKTWHGRMVNRRKDGALFSEEVIISPVRDPDGSVTAYVAVKRDISDRLALEAQLLHAQKMESIGRLAAGVAHDFNNLLTVILSHAAFGLASVGASDAVRENLLEVRKAGERGAALTRQLLVFSRKRASQRQLLDLNVVITDLKRMLQTLIGEDIEVVHLPAAAPCWVDANIGEIEQMIMNLAVNARDAMHEGGRFTIETANVTFDATAAARHDGAAPGRYVQLTVSDSGLGMDERTMAQAFEPFFTTKVAGKGTGLGLSIVYGIVQQSGGSILVRSQVGLGTTFTVCLPRGTPGPGVAELPPMETVRRGRCTETILVAEDEDALRKAVVRILTAAGYVVLDAIDAKDALAIGASHKGRIDLLLSDMVMPHTSGRLLAMALTRERPDIKVLFMSGYADDLVDDQLKCGAAVHLLAKPFSSADLTSRVRAVLDGSVSVGNHDPSVAPEHR